MFQTTNQTIEPARWTTWVFLKTRYADKMAIAYGKNDTPRDRMKCLIFRRTHTVCNDNRSMFKMFRANNTQPL